MKRHYIIVIFIVAIFPVLIFSQEMNIESYKNAPLNCGMKNSHLQSHSFISDIYQQMLHVSKCNDEINSSFNPHIVSIEVKSQFGNDQLFTYTYNDNTKILVEIWKRWLNNEWIDVRRNSYSYDENNNLSIYLWESWKTFEWSKFSQTKYIYDENGKIISIILEYWRSYKWVDDIRTTYTYDENGNVIEELNEQWTGYFWVNISKTTYTYDEDNHPLTKFAEEWEDEKWVYEGQKNNFTYDEDGKLIMNLIEKYVNDEWVRAARTINTYNTNGKIEISTSEIWRDEKWSNNLRYTYTYDDNNNLIAYIFERWINDEWFNYMRETYTYNNGNEIAFWLHENWNGEWNEFDSQFIFEDSNGNSYGSFSGSKINFIWFIPVPTLVTLKFPEDESVNVETETVIEWNESEYAEKYHLQISKYRNFFDNIIDENELTETSTTATQLDYDTRYYWRVKAINHGGESSWSETRSFTTEELVSVDKELDMQFHVANIPNPFNESTKINYSIGTPGPVSIDIYNSLGNKITHLINEYQVAGEHQAVFDGSAYPTGVYYYTLRAGDRVESGKLVLLR